MNSTLKHIQALCGALVLAVVLTGVAGGDPARDERAALQAERSALQAKVAALKREQDFLLFQKMMYTTDTKYLVINVSKHTAQLKYKNRVLKDLRFRTSDNFGRGPQPGMLMVTKKEEGKMDRRALVFGKSLIIHWKRASVPREEAGIPSAVLAKKDMQSVYFAVEEGATAYIIR